ncbi:hypothetical protein PUR57_35025 [Streptomyces sp. JV176]|uniref:DUF3592 domain-containing protein n=1 Tax=Streptomyces sp. JV176 TaxID=858630 RepID=UPI002E7624B4|nr:DUF3592 domain-containing protein [Streptomyces sp. JV176]MEE1803825.1 hypothetical protein [Streptomyces sp. JV176]
MNVIRFMLVMFALPPVVVVFVNLYALRKGRGLERSGRRVEGECVNHYWPAGGYVGVICEYSAGDGMRASVKSSKYTVAPVEVGDVVEILYDPQNSRRAMLSFEAANRVGYDTLILSIGVALFLAPATGLLFTF